jgi:uncharacterized protein (TIGR02271 family)
MANAELMQGMKVRSRDGANLGKIVRIEGEHFLVEKGFFFPKDYEIPISLVSDVRDGEAWLASSSAELQGTGTAAPVTGAGTMAGEHDERMQLSEEELEARKRVRDAGEVEIRKEVTTEHRQIDVPITKEEVHVERAPVSGERAPEGEAFREETIRVPVREEEIEVTKKPRVREEVRVSKTARQEERRVEGEVRHEEARVEKSGEPRPSGYGIGLDDDTQ